MMLFKDLTRTCFPASAHRNCFPTMQQNIHKLYLHLIKAQSNCTVNIIYFESNICSDSQNVPGARAKNDASKWFHESYLNCSKMLMVCVGFVNANSGEHVNVVCVSMPSCRRERCHPWKYTDSARLQDIKQEDERDV